jgi:hypothetical protein
MNKFFRIVWSLHTANWVFTPKTAGSHGKGDPSRGLRVLPWWPLASQAMPSGRRWRCRTLNDNSGWRRIERIGSRLRRGELHVA